MNEERVEFQPSEPIWKTRPRDIYRGNPGNETFDVIFIIDGSGSITNTFTLQKKGIRNSICGPDSFIPHDGTVAIAVIQFNDSARVEIPLTAIDSQSDAETLCVDVLAIRQLGGGTDLAPALIEAETIFESATGLDKILIISTDGSVVDEQQVLAKCETLRTLSTPVKICTVLVGWNCDPPPSQITSFLKRCANTDDALTYNSSQPTGLFRCVEAGDEEGYAMLCHDCNCALINSGGPDCDGDGRPDACESDCNNNGIPDGCDVIAGTSPDCNNNAIPDECEFWDCNGNGIFDDCELLHYNIIDLGTLGGNYSAATCLTSHWNEAYMIAGISETASGDYHATLWEQDWEGTGEWNISDLGTLGGNYSKALGVSDHGWIVGCSKKSNGQMRAFLSRYGGPMEEVPAAEDAGPTYAWASSPYPYARASSSYPGLIVGETMMWPGFYKAYLKRDGRYPDSIFTSYAEQTWARSINEWGQVVGYYETKETWAPYCPGGDYHAFLWEDGVFTDLYPDTTSTVHTWAMDINKWDQIVGFFEINRGLRACLWEDGEFVNIGNSLGSSDDSWANAINDCGYVVGGGDGDVSSALLWVNGVVIDLEDTLPPDSGWSYLEAEDINNSFQIVGRGLFNGEWHAFIMTPDTAPPTVTNIIPEDWLSTTNRKQPFHADMRDNACLQQVVLSLDGSEVLRSICPLGVPSAPIDYTPPKDLPYGEHFYELYVSDTSGNVTVVTRNFTVIG